MQEIQTGTNFKTYHHLCAISQNVKLKNKTSTSIHTILNITILQMLRVGTNLLEPVVEENRTRNTNCKLVYKPQGKRNETKLNLNRKLFSFLHYVNTILQA